MFKRETPSDQNKTPSARKVAEAMMKIFIDWFVALGWQAALCFMFALCGSLVILVLLIDALLRKISTWYWDKEELRADLKRRADARKARDWDLLKFPLDRVDRSKIDPAYRNGHFNVPYNQRDKKGITR